MNIYTVTMQFRVEAEGTVDVIDEIDIFKREMQDVQGDWLPTDGIHPGMIEFLPHSIHYYATIKEQDDEDFIQAQDDEFDARLEGKK